MKKIIVPAILMFITCLVSAQNTDLIVTTNGDSIACEIMEVNDSEVIFKMKYNSNIIQLGMNLDEITEFKYDVVQKGKYIFKHGTSYIIGKTYQYTPGTSYPITPNTYSLNSLQNSSNDELGFYRYKALKVKKAGTIVTLVGSAFTLTGLALLSTGTENNGYVGYSMVLIGLPITIIGLPILITGSLRVKRINGIKNTVSDGAFIEIEPCSFQNQMARNYHPGVTLRITF